MLKKMGWRVGRGIGARLPSTRFTREEAEKGKKKEQEGDDQPKKKVFTVEVLKFLFVCLLSHSH